MSVVTLFSPLTVVVVDGARVVRHDVARLQAELLEEERVAGRDLGALAGTRRGERRAALGAAVDRVDEFQPLHAVVVLRGGLDEDLVHARRAQVSPGLDKRHRRAPRRRGHRWCTAARRSRANPRCWPDRSGRGRPPSRWKLPASVPSGFTVSGKMSFPSRTIAARRWSSSSSARAAGPSCREARRCRRPRRSSAVASPVYGRVDELHLHPLDERERGGLDLEDGRASRRRTARSTRTSPSPGRWCFRTGRRPGGPPSPRARMARVLLGRVNRSTSVELKPCSRAAIEMSEPRATVAFPGVTSMRYGTRGFDSRHRHQHGHRAVAKVRRTEGEDERRCRRDRAEHRKRPAQALSLESASKVRRLAVLDGRLHHLPQQLGRLAGLLAAAAPARPTSTALTRTLLERRLVLFEVERHLLIADAATQRPHEEEPAERHEHHVQSPRGTTTMDAGLKRNCSRP